LFDNFTPGGCGPLDNFIYISLGAGIERHSDTAKTLALRWIFLIDILGQFITGIERQRGATVLKKDNGRTLLPHRSLESQLPVKFQGAINISHAERDNMNMVHFSS
jgi:hypothetical protein